MADQGLAVAASFVVVPGFADLVARLGRAPARVGLMGGSFDPVHNGHVELAAHAQRALELDCVVWVPARQNPLKDASPVDGRLRLDMLVAAAASAAERGATVFVCTWELGRAQPSFSVETLREARRVLGSRVELFWLSGADVLPSLYRWRDVHEILKLAHFSVMSRAEPLTDGFVRRAMRGHFSEAEIDGVCRHTVPNKLVQVSSTRVRAALAQGHAIDALVPPAVAAIICEHKLYHKSRL